MEYETKVEIEKIEAGSIEEMRQKLAEVSITRGMVAAVITGILVLTSWPDPQNGE